MIKRFLKWLLNPAPALTVEEMQKRLVMLSELI